jgi:hypothetical protein
MMTRPAEERSSKEKPRVATASKPKRKHDDSEDDSDDDDPPPSKKCKCGRRSPEKSSYLCSDCVSGDSRRHASQRNALEDTNYNEDDVNDGSEFDESKVDDNDNDNDDIAFDNVLDNDDDGDDNEEEHNDDLKQQMYCAGKSILCTLSN